MRAATSCLLGFLVVALPSVADAQRGGRTRGEKSANWDQIESANPSGPRINRKDVEAFSGINVLVAKRKDLKLSDEQVKQLRERAAGEEQALATRFTTFDSLRSAMRPRAGADADEEQARLAIARQEMTTLLASIRGGYDSTFAAALTILEEGQQPPARDLVQKELAEADEKFRDKLRGPRRMPEGSPSRGGRP